MHSIIVNGVNIGGFYETKIIKVNHWKFQLCEGQPMVITNKPANGFWADSQNWQVTPPSTVKTFVQPYVSVWNDGNGVNFADFSVEVPKDIKEEFIGKIMG